MRTPSHRQPADMLRRSSSESLAVERSYGGGLPPRPARISTVGVGPGILSQPLTPSVQFVHPRNTTVASVTGADCALGCSHCGGRYLRHMVPIGRALEVASSRGSTSCLVSGGCTSDGRVPLVEHLETLAAMKAAGLRLNVHPGLLEEHEIRQIAPLAEAVSFDFVVDDRTIDEVYHSGRRGCDYVACYRALREHADGVVPHVTLGLRGGEFGGEYDAVGALREQGASRVVFLVFTPTPGTPYAEREPPRLEEVGQFLETARKELAGIPLSLGCMRPGGWYRKEVDEIALACGVDQLVVPHPETRRRAEERGVSVSFGTECCVLAAGQERSTP